jgi:hypothetical protein
VVGGYLGMAYEDVDVLAQWAGGVRFDDLLDGAAGVEGLWHVGRLLGRVARCSICRGVASLLCGVRNVSLMLGLTCMCI